MSFSTDTPPLFFEMEGVQEVSLALGHDEPVSVGCPLYNEASAVKGCLVLSSNVIAQRLDKPIDFLLKELSIIDHKNRKSYSDERINNRKSLFWTSHFCNLRRFVVINATNRLKLSLSG